MSYEYKESMKEDLQHLYEIPTGVWKYKEKLEELDEVYAKAQAFDYIKGIKDEVEADIYKLSVVREEGGFQYLGYEVFKFMNEYESGKQP